MSAGKWVITGIVAALLCVAVGWGLATTFARRDAEPTEAARASIEAARARAAESRRKVMADIAAREAREAVEDQHLRDRRDAQVAATRAAQADALAVRESPMWLGRSYLHDGEWKKLEELVESLAASAKRGPNGQFELDEVMTGIAGSLNNLTAAEESSLHEKIAAYQRQFPKSALAPLLPAMQMRAAAWQARGGGYSTSVTPEGWALFAERNRQAWEIITAVRPRCERLPMWYEKAIKIGMDANVEDVEVMKIYKEGIERFPGYHPIYAAIARRFSPRWGGNYTDADAFVRAQVAAATNAEGEFLYTFLYWEIDGYGGSDLSFFEESHVDWTRMRAGFEILLKKYPAVSNRAAFASFACRSGDGATYWKLRKDISKDAFHEAAPQGISLDVCDTRFSLKT